MQGSYLITQHNSTHPTRTKPRNSKGVERSPYKKLHSLGPEVDFEGVVQGRRMKQVPSGPLTSRLKYGNCALTFAYTLVQPGSARSVRSRSRHLRFAPMVKGFPVLGVVKAFSECM